MDDDVVVDMVGMLMGRSSCRAVRVSKIVKCLPMPPAIIVL